MGFIDKYNIQKYAETNTSPKMPIEKQYVNAFLDALLNSTSITELYEILQDKMQNGDSFVIFNSFHKEASNLNREPYRSIIAYSMLKKDLYLFKLISASMFTGRVLEYHGSDLYTDVTKTTDESPIKYTDRGLYTDMSEGLIQIGFQNYYVDKPADDGGGSEYQTISELNTAMLDFDYIITLTKPARVEVLVFFVPYCYLSGTETNVYTCNIDQSYPEFSSPFGDRTSMNIINNLTDNELKELYKEVVMYDTEHEMQRVIEVERSVTTGKDYVLISYYMRCQSSQYSESSSKMIWSRIEIYSNIADRTFIEARVYDSNKNYYEKYIPIMLRLYDNDPDGPCLALRIENITPTIGAMFYTRDKR